MERSRRLTGTGILFIAFAFTVMADPVSSIAYAIESALHHLEGDLDDLLLTMILVLGTIVVIAATYHQLIRRFPEGGGARAAWARPMATRGPSSRSAPCWWTS